MIFVCVAANKSTPSVWVGTNSGLIYIYEATIPDADKRDEEPVQATLSK